MKQNVVKRAVCVTVGCAMLLAMVGCGSSSSSSSVPQPTETPGSQEETAEKGDLYENLKMGLGIVLRSEADATADTATLATSGKLSHIAVTVLLEDDVIRGSLLDEHESSASTLEGGMAFSTEVKSKRELGDTYGMRSYSGIGKEWYEQADAFCHYIQGMTCEEVMAIPVDESGKTTEPDLAAGCTISIATFQEAVSKACDNAKKVNDMEVEDYTNHMNGNGDDGIWEDLTDGASDVLEGVEDGVSDLVNGVEGGVTDMENSANGRGRVSY